MIEPYYEEMPEPKNYKIPGKGDLVAVERTGFQYHFQLRLAYGFLDVHDLFLHFIEIVRQKSAQ